MARILLIEDDDTIRTMLERMLVRFGHSVTAASDGKRGLARFQPTECDLVITDIVMPEADGIEVLVALRERKPGLKVIAISGGGRIGAADHLQMARMLGAAKILAKPFRPEELLALVNEALAGTPDSPQVGGRAE